MGQTESSSCSAAAAASARSPSVSLTDEKKDESEGDEYDGSRTGRVVTDETQTEGEESGECSDCDCDCTISDSKLKTTVSSKSLGKKERRNQKSAMWFLSPSHIFEYLGSAHCVCSETPAVPPSDDAHRRRKHKTGRKSRGRRQKATAVPSLTSNHTEVEGSEWFSEKRIIDGGGEDSSSDECISEEVFGAADVNEALYFWCHIPRRVRGVVPRENGPGDIERVFEKVAQLGSGHVGTVWHVVKRTTGEALAMKALPRHRVSDKAFVFECEALLKLKSMDCPGLISFEGAYCDEQCYFVVTELAQFDLFTALHSKYGGRMNERLVKKAMRQVLVALQWLHSKGVVHRDVKPDNIVCVGVGHFKLIDVEHMTAVTDDLLLDDLCGTARYMSPERFRKYNGFEAKQSDIWAAGICVFELLTGYRCFEGESTMTIQRNIVDANWSWPSCDASSSAKDFVKRCLHTDPRVRLSAFDALNHHWFLVSL